MIGRTRLHVFLWVSPPGCHNQFCVRWMCRVPVTHTALCRLVELYWVTPSPRQPLYLSVNLLSRLVLPATCCAGMSESNTSAMQAAIIRSLLWWNSFLMLAGKTSPLARRLLCHCVNTLANYNGEWIYYVWIFMIHISTSILVTGNGVCSK